MIIINEKCRAINLFELQGESENIKMFDGIFNEDKITLEFKNFYLQGKQVAKEVCILEKENSTLTIAAKNVKYYVFDKPPIYKF